VAVKSRIWRLLKTWEEKAVKELILVARKQKAAIVVDVPNDNSVRELKEGSYASEKKIFLNFGRLRRRLKEAAAWHGIPYYEKRLYSTVCPRCGEKMKELSSRRVKCICGFEAYRDDVPIIWAVKLYPQLISFSSSAGNCLKRFSGVAGGLLGQLRRLGGPGESCGCIPSSPHAASPFPLLRAGLLPAPAHGPRSLLETSSNTSLCASTSAASTRAKRKPGGCSASSDALVP